MDAPGFTDLREPVFEERPAMRLAGLSGDFAREQMDQIPALWQRFNAELLSLPSGAWVGEATYGVVYPTPIMRYVCAVGLTQAATLPHGWVEENIPARHYAIFAETGGVAAIRRVWPAIFNHWLPHSGRKLAPGALLESYPPSWPQSGDFEIWIPLEP